MARVLLPNLVAVALAGWGGFSAAQEAGALGAPSLGVMTSSLTGQGAFVIRVFRGGPGDLAGLRSGDVITGADRASFRNEQELSSFLETAPLGQATAFQVLRAGRVENLSIVPERAVPLYTRLCEADDFEACGTIGYMLATGARVPQIPSKGESFLKKACDGGWFPSCVNLGNVYERGQLGAPDGAQAARAYERACDGGLIEGCIDLGRLLRTGRGVPKDEARAIALYQQACDANDVETCSFLAQAYLHGIGVPVDRERARTLFRRACDLGSEIACSSLREIQ